MKKKKQIYHLRHETLKKKKKKKKKKKTKKRISVYRTRARPTSAHSKNRTRLEHGRVKFRTTRVYLAAAGGLVIIMKGKYEARHSAFLLDKRLGLPTFTSLHHLHQVAKTDVTTYYK